MVYLLCQWAKAPVTPTELVVWSPTTEIGTWTDGGGAGQTGDYPTFLATVDFNTLSDLNLSGTGITSLTVGNCPMLTTINCSHCASLTDLDVSVCSSLVTLDCHSSNITGTLDLTGLSNLTTIDCNSNPNLSSLIVTGCTGVVTLTSDTVGISSLDVTPCISIQTVSVSLCPNLTTLTTNGCLQLSTILGGFSKLTNAAPDYVINQLLVNCVATGIHLIGTIDTFGQNPAAPPSSPGGGFPDGIAAAATLNAAPFFWSVLTD